MAGNQASMQASMQASKQASKQGAFSRSHALQGLVSFHLNGLFKKNYTSQFCPKSNLIKDYIPVLGLDIVERQDQFFIIDHGGLK